jgi:hypothetical protein
MPRFRDPPDTDEDELVGPPSRRSRTPVHGVEAIHDPFGEVYRSLSSMQKRLREAEDVIVVLMGSHGSPGAMQSLRDKVDGMKSDVAELGKQHRAMESTITGLQRLHFKVIVAGATAGSIVALATAIFGAIWKAVAP